MIHKICKIERNGSKKYFEIHPPVIGLPKGYHIIELDNVNNFFIHKNANGKIENSDLSYSNEFNIWLLNEIEKLNF